MAEQYPSDNALEAMTGTTLDPGVPIPTIGDDPQYTVITRYLWRIATSLVPLAGMEIYKDGDLTFAVRAGRFMDGATARAFSAVAAQALTDEQTNYIYVEADGTLTVNTTGFPAAGATPHVPLATIVTSGGVYDFDNVTDYRGRSIFQCVTAMTPADMNTLVGGGDGDSLHVHAPNLKLTAAAEDADERVITIQCVDANDTNLSGRHLVRVWIATSDYGAPDATGNTVSVDTGTTYETETANAAYKIISDATGKVDVGITISGAATRYIMAEIDGRIYSSGQVDWAA